MVGSLGGIFKKWVVESFVFVAVFFVFFFFFFVIFFWIFLLDLNISLVRPFSHNTFMQDC